jgi:hypothetical protein
MSSPLRAVLAALADGAPSRAAVAASTGLPRDVVDAAVGHLLRIGRLDAVPLTVGCPETSCGRCVFRRAGSSGCGGVRPSARRARPGLVSLSVRGGGHGRAGAGD